MRGTSKHYFGKVLKGNTKKQTDKADIQNDP
jgi:hypothetical protein